MMSSTSADSPNAVSVKPIKIDNSNIVEILLTVTRKFTAIKQVASFNILSECVSDASIFSTNLSYEEFKWNLKKSVHSKKFSWIYKREPLSGILLYFLVGINRDKAVIFHLSKLNDLTEIRIFSKSKYDLQDLPENTVTFIERLVSVYKANHKNSKKGPPRKIFLNPGETFRMSTTTSLQYSVYLI